MGEYNMPDGSLYPSGNISTMRLTGYADLFGVNPGNKIKFYVNCNGPEKYKVQIVKMINGDTNPRGPGLLEEAIDAKCNGEHSGKRQVIHSGSYGYVEDKPHFILNLSQCSVGFGQLLQKLIQNIGGMGPRD
jgi:hypothetical protein